MTDDKILDLDALAERPPQISLNGEQYDILRQLDLEPLDAVRLQATQRALEDFDLTEDLTEEQAQEATAARNDFIRVLVPSMPEEVRKNLSARQKAKITFFLVEQLQSDELPDFLQKMLNGNGKRRTGARQSRRSNASTAATQTAGTEPQRR